MRTYRGSAAIALAVVLYGAMSLLIFGSTQSWLTNFVGSGADPESYIWGLNWWPWAVGHGIYPLVSKYVWYPQGFHLAWADAAPAAAVMGLPFTIAGNAALAYNVLMVGAPVASATTTFILARYLTRDVIASLFAGYLLGFSTYQIAHGYGHLSLVLTFLVPLIVLLTLKRMAQEISRRRFVGLLAICLLIQFGITMEIFATVCVFGAMAWLVGFIFSPAGLRRHMVVVALEIALAAVIVVVVALPWLISMYRGRADVPNVINDPNQYGTDLLNFVSPNGLTWLRNSLSRKIAGNFSDNWVETSGYVGLPLIGILVWWFCESWRTIVGRYLLCMVLLFVLLSLGPRLTVDGAGIAVWTPWRIFLGLPLIRHALPGRFSFYVALTAAVAVGFWLASARTWFGRTSRYALTFVAAAAIFPDLHSITWSKLPYLPFFERENLERVVGKDANLVVLPFLYASGAPGPSMIWQWQSGMAFTQSGGYVGNVPPEEYHWAAIASFDRLSPGPDFGNDISAYAASHRVNAIIAGPGTQKPFLDALDDLGWKQEETGGVRVYHTPDLSTLPYYRMSGAYWPGTQAADWTWIGNNATIYANGADYTVDIRGSWRPKTLPLATVVIEQDGTSRTETIDPAEGLQIPLPAGHQMTLTSSSTFVPSAFDGGKDMREMSVMLRVTPD